MATYENVVLDEIKDEVGNIYKYTADIDKENEMIYLDCRCDMFGLSFDNIKKLYEACYSK